MDLTSIKHKSLGGNKFWLVIVDDATGKVWSIFVKAKSDVPRKMIRFLHGMRKNKTPVQFIRCDNAGENRKTQELCENDADIPHIQFEYTARDSPQFNGRVERMIAVLTSRVRAVLNAAKLPKSLRLKLWTEAARTVTDIENYLTMLNEWNAGDSNPRPSQLPSGEFNYLTPSQNSHLGALKLYLFSSHRRCCSLTAFSVQKLFSHAKLYLCSLGL